MLVNSRNEKLDVSLTLKHLAHARLISPVDMLERPATVIPDDNGTKLSFTIGEYETILID